MFEFSIYQYKKMEEMEGGNIRRTVFRWIWEGVGTNPQASKRGVDGVNVSYHISSRGKGGHLKRTDVYQHIH